MRLDKAVILQQESAQTEAGIKRYSHYNVKAVVAIAPATALDPWSFVISRLRILLERLVSGLLAKFQP